MRRGALVENIGKVLQDVVFGDEIRYYEFMGGAALPVGTQEEACPARIRAMQAIRFPSTSDRKSFILPSSLRDPSFLDSGSWPNADTERMTVHDEAT